MRAEDSSQDALEPIKAQKLPTLNTKSNKNKYFFKRYDMEDYEIWIKKAGQDIKTAKYNIKGKEIEAGAFFLQQSAEKALKAVYIKRFKKLIKTHDLVRLAKEIGAPDKIVNGCKKLTLIYQYTRYPDVSPDTGFSKEEINDFIKSTEELLKWTKGSL